MNWIVKISLRDSVTRKQAVGIFKFSRGSWVFYQFARGSGRVTCFIFCSSNRWRGKTASYQSIRVTDRSSRPIACFRRLSRSNPEMSSPGPRLMRRRILCHRLGKFNFRILCLLTLNLQFRFNAKWIPKTDETLNSTSRRYGTEPMP